MPGACEEHGSFFAVKDHTVPSHARLTAPSLVTIKPVISTEVETTDSGSILYDTCIRIFFVFTLSVLHS